jgi:hypothetical protein
MDLASPMLRRPRLRTTKATAMPLVNATIPRHFVEATRRTGAEHGDFLAGREELRAGLRAARLKRARTTSHAAA